MHHNHHCTLCDHVSRNLKDGFICGITAKKPAFNVSCSTIKLGKKFEDKLVTANADFKKAKGMKWYTYAYFVVFIVLAVATLFILNILNDRIPSISESTRVVGYSIVVFIVLIAVSLTLIGMAVGALNKYFKDLKKTKEDLKKINDVLDVYHITYELDLNFGKKYHGVQDLNYDLKFNNIRDSYR